MRYELLEHTADIMVRTRGSTLSECFENAAFALFDQMVEVEQVEEKVERSFKVDGFDIESLLLNFLSEFLFIHDTTRLVFRRFEVRMDGLSLTCKAWGEEIDLDKHRAKREIKAITYHMMSIDEKEPSVQVLFDI